MGIKYVSFYAAVFVRNFFRSNGYLVHYVRITVKSSVGEMITAYDILIGNYEWNRPLGRSTHRWIRLDIMKICCKGVNWLRVNTVKYRRVGYKAAKVLTRLTTVGFSETTVLHIVSY